MHYLYLCAVLCAAMSLTGVFDDGAETSDNNRDYIPWRSRAAAHLLAQPRAGSAN
jgi:hypothetical protein